MPDTKLSALPSLPSVLTTGDAVHVVRSGVNYQAPPALLKLPRTQQTLTTSGTIVLTTDTAFLNGTNITGTLVAASTNAGQRVTVNNINATNATVDTAGGTINGQVSWILPQYASLTVESDGSNYWVV